MGTMSEKLHPRNGTLPANPAFFRRIATEHGFNRSRLARHLGVDAKTVRKLLSGKFMSPSTFRDINGRRGYPIAKMVLPSAESTPPVAPAAAPAPILVHTVTLISTKPLPRELFDLAAEHGLSVIAPDSPSVLDVTERRITLVEPPSEPGGGDPSEQSRDTA